MHDGDLVLQGQALRILRVELNIGLRIVADDLERPAEQATGRVQFVHRELDAEHHGLTAGSERAGLIVQAPD